MSARRDSDDLKFVLQRQFEESRRQTDALFNIIDPAAFYQRPIEERHRIIFYLGHLEAFDWNLICRTSFERTPLHQEFEHLFAFGIDPINGDLPRDKASDWPAIDAVRRYNNQARDAVDDCLMKANLSGREQPYVQNGLIFWAAIEHRLMHLETLSYMMHWLPFEMKRGLTPPIAEIRRRPAAQKIRVPAGRVTLGLNRTDTSFGWDNEFEAHVVDIPEFEIDVYKVSNGDFMEFVDAGAYEERSLWTEDGWKWITERGVRHPKFWAKRGNAWLYRTIFGEIPLPESWPVYVSHSEASAYARWKKQQLPTEAEFDRAALGQQGRGHFGLHSWDPVAVQSNSDVKSAFGAVEMIGNGWEWTSSTFVPYPGFERFPFYPGYSENFFDGKHFVLKGASPRTASRLVRPSFRNWFQAQYPYIYSGFRCVQH